MSKLLLVEDSSFFRGMLTNVLGQVHGVEIVAVETKAEAIEAIEESDEPFFLSFLDLNLPDAPRGEVVDVALQHGIPALIFTASYDETLREKYLEKGVLDFVLKDNPARMKYLVNLVQRVHRNRNTEVIVVDDSRFARDICTTLLKKFCLNVITLETAEEVLEELDRNDKVRLVVTDYQMPGMDGFELVSAIRRGFDRDQIAIIGVSAYGDAALSVKFMKHGANDFIYKPYHPEELYTRVAMNLDMLDNVEELTNAATKDYLTGLYNRRYFMDVGGRFNAQAKRAKEPMALAILDIDKFKAVNDTYGHDVGDLVLQHFAKVLEENTNRADDICARMGGEEFAILVRDTNPDAILTYFEKLRATIEATTIDFGSGVLNVTTSIGVVVETELGLDDMISKADGHLYTAKHNGRNQVVLN